MNDMNPNRFKLPFDARYERPWSESSVEPGARGRVRTMSAVGAPRSGPGAPRLSHYAAPFQRSSSDLVFLRWQHQFQRCTARQRRKGNLQRPYLQLLPLIRPLWPVGQCRRGAALRDRKLPGNVGGSGAEPAPLWSGGFGLSLLGKSQGWSGIPPPGVHAMASEGPAGPGPEDDSSDWPV